MNSLEWRLKKIENKLLGSNSSVSHIDRVLSQSNDQNTIYNQFIEVSKHYKQHLSTDGSYTRFMELYSKFKHLMNENKINNECDQMSKAELVLAYEDDLKRHFQNMETMTQKADQVLDINKWPELVEYQEKLDKIQKINLEQLRQSQDVDDKTEKLIEVYNDIISSFKSNMIIWNNKLEAYENEEKKTNSDDD